MPGQCISPDAASDFANKDTNRIVGKIAEVLAARSPFMDILEGGTIPNVSDTVRSVVEERASLGNSLAKPVFTNDVSLCGSVGQQDQVGSTEYSYALQSLRGRGPRVCVKTARTAFKDSYVRAQQALEKAVLQLTNADIKSTLHIRSGVKYTVNSTKTFNQSLAGDSQNIDTKFANFLPDSQPTFRLLQKLTAFLTEEMYADPFESNTGTMVKFIGSWDVIEGLRAELQIREDLRAFVKGHYRLGERDLGGYAFEGPYRGIAFGIDQQPLRSNGLDGNGDLVLLEPEIPVATSKGVASRRNPAWVAGMYEVAFLIAADSFRRLTPEQYTGEGTFKFAPQLFMGELVWRYIIDNDCNLFGDFGQHIYQISRAFQPVRPHAVIPILFKRCDFNLGIATCASGVAGL